MEGREGIGKAASDIWDPSRHDAMRAVKVCTRWRQASKVTKITFDDEDTLFNYSFKKCSYEALLQSLRPE